MGNTYVKKQYSEARRSQLLAVFVKRGTEKPSRSEPHGINAVGNGFMKSRPVTRRMAIFGQDYEKSKVDIAKPVKVDFVYQISKSKVIVDPFDCQPDTDYLTVERSIHGKDNERVFKTVLQEMFTPLPSSRKKGGTSERRSE